MKRLSWCAYEELDEGVGTTVRLVPFSLHPTPSAGYDNSALHTGHVPLLKLSWRLSGHSLNHP